MRPAPVVVRLDMVQRRAAYDAVRIKRAWVAEHKAVSVFSAVDAGSIRYDNEVCAIAAEIAAGIATGRRWLGAKPGTRNEGDLEGGVEVHHTLPPRGRLHIRPEDADERPYVLVTGRPPTFTVRGWMLGAEAKRPEFWWPNAPRRPCWAVGQDCLLDIAKL